MIPHYKPSFDESEVAAAVSVIRSGQLAQGEMVAALEHQFAKSINRHHAVAVSSGTTALSLSLLSLNIGKDDEVIIPSYTCSALWHAVRAVSATPIYCEIEPVTFNLDPMEIRKKISPKTKAVIFPHMFGQPGRINELTEIGIPVIEDIAQSVGARINDRPVGSFGDITISSFYATKPIGAGEGGIVLTDDTKLAERIRSLREYDEQETLT
ncbi:MAG: aminotransferase class I/II-fold pyridoxal phosphate-dependent enzyme, partial [Candidatus Marinimicrobia bacterium]|nr:aminotransferase class I/II-fold pyridoxal phosphate-dependent enzyme [Candidatus Neomarinimicrobiota bacterium]